MKQIAQRAALVAALLASVGVPARADVAADVQKKIDAALKTSKSFVVTTRYPTQAYVSTLVVVAPDRARLAVAIAANTTDVVTVGATSYSSKNGAPFEKAAVSAEGGTPVAPSGSVKVGALRADVTIDGVSYGAFETTLPLGAPVTLTCAYDKKTFRLARCANKDVTRTYGGYDDPKNVVELPKNIAEAPAGGK